MDRDEERAIAAQFERLDSTIVEDLTAMWGGRLPTWEEFRSSHSRGIVRVSRHLAYKSFYGNAAVRKACGPRFGFGFAVPVGGALAIFAIPILACFVLKLSYWFVPLGWLVISPLFYKSLEREACRGLEAGAARNENLYETLVRQGAFLFSPTEASPQSSLEPAQEWPSVRDSLARSIVKPFGPLVLVLGFAITQLIRFGNVHDYFFLTMASCVSGAAMFGYGLIPVLDRGKKSWLLSFVALAAFVPYLFGCYLVFYRGLWRIKELFTHFSIDGLAARIIFVLLGWYMLYTFWLLTELVKNLHRPIVGES